MKSKALITATLCALLFATTASASIQVSDGWTRLETEHFTLFSNLDESATREIGADLERLRMVLEKIFTQATFDSPLPTLLYIFKDEASYAPFSLSGGAPGFLVAHSQANFAAVMGADAGEALPIVYRQYLLELINDNLPQLPGWFQMGMAELFSTFEASGQIAVVGLIGAGNLGVQISDSSSPSGVLEGKIDVGVQDISLSQAVVHYLLVEDPERREKTQTWLRALDDKPDSSVSLLAGLGTSGDEFDAAVSTYLAQETLPSKAFTLDKEPTAGDMTILARHEALFHLGDLLMHSSPDRQSEASQLLEESLELAPDNPYSIAGVGLAREKAGDLEAASDYYERAIVKLPDGFRLQFLYGDVELELLGKRRPTNSEEEARLEKAIAAFRRTTEINPGFGEGWARLGYSYNLQASPSGDAIAALERSYEMLPDRSDVAYNLLLGYARSGKREEATTLVSNLEARGGDEATLQRSREILYQLDFQAAGAMARAKKYDEARKIFTEIIEKSTDAGLKERAEQALSALGGN